MCAWQWRGGAARLATAMAERWTKHWKGDWVERTEGGGVELCGVFDEVEVGSYESFPRAWHACVMSKVGCELQNAGADFNNHNHFNHGVVDLGRVILRVL